MSTTDGHHQNSQPTWAPPGDLAWIAFNSKREYGVVAPDGTQQIWVAAVDLSKASAGLDHSYPAFRLQFQGLAENNHRAYWTLDVRDPSDGGVRPDAQTMEAGLCGTAAPAMVATPDIGRAAAHALLEPPPAHQIVGITGPARYSYAEAAAVIGEALNKPVSAFYVPREGVVPALTGVGMSEDNAKNFLELSIAIEAGKLEWAGDERVVRGKTTAAAHLRALLG